MAEKILPTLAPGVRHSTRSLDCSSLRPLLTFARLVPTTHASVLIQGLSGLPVPYTQTLVSWVALPAFTVAFLALALLKAKWREN